MTFFEIEKLIFYQENNCLCNQTKLTEPTQLYFYHDQNPNIYKTWFFKLLLKLVEYEMLTTFTTLV